MGVVLDLRGTVAIDDAENVRETATGYVRRYGSEAPAYLSAQATLARINGDPLSNDAWKDLAEAAAALLMKEAS